MKATVYSIEGKPMGEIALPKAFEEPLNRELIKRAVLSIESKKKQPKGAYLRAGRNTTAEARGSRKIMASERTINIDRARLPRLKNRRHLAYGQVAAVPQAVHGPEAHPPKSAKVFWEDINRKEKRKALLSAIAASCNRALVAERHVLNEGTKLPLVVENNFEGMDKTKKVLNVLKALNLIADIENAKGKCRKRAGKGKARGRKKKQKKSLLIVTKGNAKVYKAARNIPGIDVSAVSNLNAELLAPGCKAGRLVLWTEDAIKALGEKVEKA